MQTKPLVPNVTVNGDYDTISDKFRQTVSHADKSSQNSKIKKSAVFTGSTTYIRNMIDEVM